MPDWSGSFVWSLVFTLVVTTCLGSFLWLYVLRELPAGIAGLGTMGTPVVGVLASWAQLGEEPTVFEAVGMVVVLAGMAVLFARGMRDSAPDPEGTITAE
jgi:drug/metabolite transporter (DMT)-like permease